MILRLWKYQGTGNDFIMIDNRKDVFSTDEKTIARLCKRRTGIGADGMIMLHDHHGLDFSMHYFNADGKEASMCGNGGRCAVAFARFLGISGDHTRFMAADGIHEGEIHDNLISLKMQDVANIRQEKDYFFLNTGAPHYVTFRADVMHIDVASYGKTIRYRDDFQPEGTNVNFVQIIDSQTLFNRTYEKGVENETLSCGTGSVAAALSLTVLRQNVRSPVTVRTPGGKLSVYFTRKDKNRFTDIRLEGPAVPVFEGIIQLPDTLP